MRIEAHGLGKRFGRDWIFRDLTYAFEPGSATALLGPNGAGKSTLLQVLAAYTLPSAGELRYTVNSRAVRPEEVAMQLALCAPYLELIEELTLQEQLQFHTRFRPLRAGLSPAQLIELLQLGNARHKLIRDFSSGMKQRVKLGLALYTDAPLLLLDEPTTNLDRAGVAWYHEHVAATTAGRTVLVSSNVEEEYAFCGARLLVTDFAVRRS
ncbi:ABC transporter ATP-binding protein [Hymenobacter busanensis]|uniref:ABC transporter ATP-binding protein n=1 Tax=Hymenobacter busanensis TaxID=2607656 RepID=A0A7L4ZT91_9BACT|nr:ABC transporter ATP-binding protein [Hymenobacter busanensis]KAA9339676.1 ABC transporter ATP-binding protein [Hymenobacter busanensis]QHJ06569.1 ATP-binding cassette domain-containing protein [Hymenobacter busanensis]